MRARALGPPREKYEVAPVMTASIKSTSRDTFQRIKSRRFFKSKKMCCMPHGSLSSKAGVEVSSVLLPQGISPPENSSGAGAISNAWVVLHAPQSVPSMLPQERAAQEYCPIGKPVVVFSRDAIVSSSDSPLGRLIWYCEKGESVCHLNIIFPFHPLL